MLRTQSQKDHVLDREIPHRLQSLYALTRVATIRAKKDPHDAGSFSLWVNGSVEVQGTAAGVTNAWLEVGIVHGRALLEFLGLGEKDGKLAKRTRARRNDWRLSTFGLPLVTPAEAIAAYTGDPAEAERSLVSIMLLANRAIAHMTDPADFERFDLNHLEIASRGIYALFLRHLYKPLGKPEPPFGFPPTERPATQG